MNLSRAYLNGFLPLSVWLTECIKYMVWKEKHFFPELGKLAKIV